MKVTTSQVSDLYSQTILVVSAATERYTINFAHIFL